MNVPLLFSVLGDDALGLMGSPLKLECPPEASEPGASIEWEDKVYKPTRERFLAWSTELGTINPDHTEKNRFSVDPEDNFALTIDNTNSEDAGPYICIVMLEDGSRFEKESSVSVTGALLTPLFKIKCMRLPTV